MQTLITQQVVGADPSEIENARKLQEEKIDEEIPAEELASVAGGFSMSTNFSRYLNAAPRITKYGGFSIMGVIK